MIGQDKLIEKLNNYDIHNFPQSNLILGLKGCGKHYFVNQVSNKLNLEIIDISFDISNEFIDELYITSLPKIYLIDIVALSKKSRYVNKENAILKFIEEPPKGAIIFILAESVSQVLNTLKNRCIIWQFAPYDINTLKQFKLFNNDDIYRIVNTPGMLLEINDEDYYTKLFAFCNNIIININRANTANTLSLRNHIECNKGEYSLSLVLKCLSYITYKQNDLEAYLLINEYLRRTYVLNISETKLFDSFILKLKDIYDRT